MGQVTIGELTEDLLPFTEKGNKVITIPIVPRAIPEKIIALCDSKIDFINGNYEGEVTEYGKGELDFANSVKDYTLNLLAYFEKEVAGEK